MSTHTHDRLVKLAIDEAVRQGATNIKADHLPAYSKPVQIGNYIPDVTGAYGSATIIIEAESADGLNMKHTVDQFATFHRAATRANSMFVVAVNAVDRAAAEQIVRQACGASAKVPIWTF